MKHARIFLIAIFVMAAMTLQAQPKHECKNMEQLESARIAFLTTRLDLSPEDAGVFWPIYNEYNKELKQARLDTRQSFHKLRTVTSDTAKVAADEVEKCIRLYLESTRRDEQIEQAYYEKFRKVLPVEKVAKLYVAEEDFRLQMIKMWKKPEK